VWTLRQLPEVAFVEISVNGTPLSVPGTTSPQSRDAWPEVNPNGLSSDAVGYASTGTGVVRLTPLEDISVPGAFGALEETFAKLAVSNDGERAIGSTSNGELVWGSFLIGAAFESAAPTVEALAGVQSIAFDGDTTAWIVDDSGTAQTLLPSGETFEIEILGLEQGDFVQSVIPSRDGTRAAIIVSTEIGSVLLLAQISRPTPANVTRIQLLKPMRVESKLSAVSAIAWSSANTIAVIATETAGTLQIYEIDLGRGEVQAQGSPADPVSIAAGPGLPTLVTSADGSIYENSSQSWIVRIQGSAAAYPG
jgi:hypothetical protein